MKRKNLVVIHLESVSWHTYNTFKNELSNLEKFMKNSHLFKNFFSSATSSMMAIQNFLYGDDKGMDHFTNFNIIKDGVRNSSDNLFYILYKNGYNTYGYGYPVFWRDELKLFNIWDNNKPFDWVEKRDIFLNSISNIIENNNNQPFAIYIWDMLSHLACLDEVKDNKKSSIERIKYGYKKIDETIKTVWDGLQKFNKLDSTTIIAFGDHGDEFWTHSFAGGFCHALEPYTTLIHTPLFIYDNDISKGIDNNLSSLIDLKKTILNILSIQDITNSSGINLFEDTNEFVFSQNLFFNQKPSQYLNKSFSVINKRYNLIVSELGLEMYDYIIDKTNHNNLLSFFKFKNHKLYFNNRWAFHPHFKMVFREYDIQEIISNFYTLLDELKNHIQKKQSLLQNTKYKPNLKNFCKIRKRKYLWEKPIHNKINLLNLFKSIIVRKILKIYSNSEIGEKIVKILNKSEIGKKIKDIFKMFTGV